MMNAVVKGFARNTVFANIALVLILAAGLMAVNAMQRELFPDFSMDEILIEVPYPGASPSEVKEGVILKIEEVLAGMEGVAQYTSQCEDNGGNAEVIVRHGYDPSEVMDRIRSRVNAISTFPGGVENPMITREMHRTEVMKLYLKGEVPDAQLVESARRIKDKLRLLDGVSQVEIFGARDYEIHVEVSEADLRTHDLTLETIAQRIAQSNLTLSGGMIRTGTRDIRVRTLARKYTGQDLEDVAVKTNPDGSILTLDRLARIRDDFTEEAGQVKVNGEPALVIEIYKTGREDALAISRAVTAFIEDQGELLPDNLTLGVVYDLTLDLRSRIDLLVKNGIMGLCLVLALLWLFLDFRLGFWVGMGIPVSILGALVVVWAMGGSINMLSLFGLITVLGIVVDDAIVVGEAVYHHFQKGLSPVDAAAQGVSEVGMPVAASIFTTILAFLPLAYIGDVIGKFLSILPMVVIPCLVVSLVESFFLLPAHLARGLKKGKRKPGIRARLQTRIQQGMDKGAKNLYLPLLNRAVKYRYSFVCGAVSVLCLCLGLVFGNLVKFEVLPDTGSPVIFSAVKMQPGTSAPLTKKAVLRVEEALLTVLNDHGEISVNNRMTMVGSTVGEDPEKGDRFGGVQAVIEGNPDIKQLLGLWQDAAWDIPGIDSLTFETREEGPPGEPIEVWLRGDDSALLADAALEFTRELEKIQGVHQIRSDAAGRVDEVQLVLRPEARYLGITPEDLARQVRGAFYGWEALRLQRGRDDLRIKVRYPAEDRKELSSLDHLGIMTPEGVRVPLRSVARISFSEQAEVIRQVDGMECLTIQAAVDEDRVNADEIIDMLSEGFLIDLSERYPDLDISFEGDEKHMNDALGGLYFGFPLAVLGMFVIVASIFRSYVQPFIILVAIPFGYIGSILGHLVMGYALSLMSIFGMVALSGIVVNDAIMLIDRINVNLTRGQDITTAVQNAGQRRFRPIILTTLSTLGGLAPLLLENSIQAKMLIPMAISISGGMISATLLTLVLIPCLFVMLNDLRGLVKRVVNRNLTTRKPGRVENNLNLTYTIDKES